MLIINVKMKAHMKDKTLMDTKFAKKMGSLIGICTIIQYTFLLQLRGVTRPYSKSVTPSKHKKQCLNGTKNTKDVLKYKANTGIF